MKKRIRAIILFMCMMLMMFPMTVLADATEIQVKDATYYDSGALKSVKITFGWDTAGATGRLVLMTQKLRSAGEAGTDSCYGDFTDFGYYGSSFSDFDAVLSHDQTNRTFGILASSEEQSFAMNTNNEMSISLAETAIPLNADKMYYVYLWTYYGGHYYPDNLFCVIQVEDGAVKYTPATDRNSFNEAAFGTVAGIASYSVSITSAANMTRDSSSGVESQSGLSGAMASVVYTANDGYYFPEDYAVAPVNGIQVSRDSNTQITVYGTPTADASITLTAPTKLVVPLEDNVFGYAYDVQRYPAFPAGAGGTMHLSSLNKPLLEDSTRKDVCTGAWTLTKAGTYSYLKNYLENKNMDTQNLESIVSDVASVYSLSEELKDKIVIHELKDGESHIAYGVVIAYDTVNERAVFIGDTWGGGAGYLLSKTALSESSELGYEVTAQMIATDFTPVVAYQIVEGMNGEWTANSNETLSFRADGDINKFLGVNLDGALVDPQNYTVESGSTIVKLKENYLKTLSVGTHHLTVVYNDGQCSTSFKIQAAVDDSENGNDTPDSENGNDTPDSGNGNGTPDTGNGNGTPDSGNGNGTPDTGNGNDTPDTGNGNETPDAGNGNDTPDTGNGNDTPDTGNGNGTPDTGNGNGTPDTGNGNETPDAGNGNDSSESDDNDDTSDDSPVATDNTAAAQPAIAIHIVQRGDTLRVIARNYGCSVAEIMAANSNLIKNVNLIYPGWQLKIPQTGVNTSQTSTQQQAVLPNGGKTQVYIVQRGDNLWTIARKHGCTTAEIIALNSRLAANPNLLYAGWELKLPQR